MDEQRRERRDEIDVEETGRKGGAASMAAGVPYAEDRAGAAYWMRDLVRWGPIWAGLLLALGIQIVLGLVGAAIALSAYDPNSADYASRVGSFTGIWSAISALVALFVGGYVAGRMAAVMGLRNGLVQGSVVWALALIASIVLSGLGAAGLLGAMNNVTGALARGLNVSGPEGRALVDSAISATWWTVVGAILACIAAALVGVLGTAAHRDAVEERH